MNEPDVLNDQLRRLADRAPVPAVDPLEDIRRGHSALRRRRGSWAMGGAATAVVAGAALGVAASLHGSDVAHDPTAAVAARPSATASPTSLTSSTSSGTIARFCARNDLLPGVGPSGRTGSWTVKGPRGRNAITSWRDPAVAPTLASYRAAAVDHLDPTGTHLDRTVTNIQYGCDRGLQSMGTELGWTSGAGLGDIAVEVGHRPGDELGVVMAHDGWTGYAGQLPAGVVSARVVDYAGGQAVEVQRTDGLVVAVDASDFWGNNAAPGSPSADSLPGLGRLLALAADPRLTLPG